MKVEISKENQKKIIITFTLVAMLITIMVLLAKIYYVELNITDAEQFYKEYGNIPVDNVFEMVTAKEAYEALDDEHAIIMFGFKECKWCQSYIPILNEVVTENNVPVVYYCNIKEDRTKNTEEYSEEISKLLKRTGFLDILKDCVMNEGLDYCELFLSTPVQNIQHCKTNRISAIHSPANSAHSAKNGCQTT